MKVLDMPQEPNKLAAANAALERDMPEIMKWQAMQAQLKMNWYKELLKQGFNPQQALELCRG